LKRREQGVNLDDGIALSTPDELRLLFVDCRPEARAALQGWFDSDVRESVLFGGQIGSGKTTLLNEVALSRPETVVIRVRFDTDPIEHSDASYTMLLVGQVLQMCLKAEINPEGSGITLSDFPSVAADSWSVFAEAISTYPSNLETARQLRETCSVIAEAPSLVRKACGVLMDRLAEKTGREPVIIAEGVDKFDPGTSDYFSLGDTLTFLAHWKTLFEGNAVHLFLEKDFRLGIRKLFIGGIQQDVLLEMFKKRLGPYAPLYSKAFLLLGKYSGGNVRQALRLLNAYYFQRTQHRKDHSAAVALACRQVSSDLLNVPFGHFPVDVFSVVKRDGYIAGSLFSEHETRLGANEAIYRNWIFLRHEPTLDAPTKWPAVINPLIDQAIEWSPAPPLSPEEKAVREWALEHEISPVGLNIPVGEDGKPGWDNFWREIEASTTSEINALSILPLLEEIGAGLFGIERQDRIIVSYRDRKNLEAVRDFLVGKANTYGYFPCAEIILQGGEGHEPVEELLIRVKDQDPNRIYSVEINGNWTDSQLRDLERRRDVLGDLQMLWWVEQGVLKRYLRFWPQLRQFFRIYRLEGELWRGITEEEIQADIDLISDITENRDPEGVRRLRSVLEFLQNQGGEP